MKKFFKSSVTFIIALAMLFTTNAISTFAAETSTINSESSVVMESGISPYSNDYKGHYHNITTSWKTIATSTTGFNCNVYIKCYGTDLSRLNIRMLGKNGNVVWSENGAVPGLGSRTFWCGSDVYTIQASSQSSTIGIYIQPA